MDNYLNEGKKDANDPKEKEEQQEMNADSNKKYLAWLKEDQKYMPTYILGDNEDPYQGE